MTSLLVRDSKMLWLGGWIVGEHVGLQQRQRQQHDDPEDGLDRPNKDVIGNSYGLPLRQIAFDDIVQLDWRRPPPTKEGDQPEHC